DSPVAHAGRNDGHQARGAAVDHPAEGCCAAAAARASAHLSCRTHSMKKSSIVVAIGAALVLSPLLFAQAPTQSPQDAQTANLPKSTALILGEIVAGWIGQPIAEAVVTMRQMGPARGTGPRGGGAGAANIPPA